MKISVVIPAFNAERHIGRAVRSVLAQTRAADEIIVVDDGSTDGTAEAVRSFGETVRLIQQPNAGASVARNTGIEAAAGEWIAFLDADDEWLPEKLDAQQSLHQQYPNLKWGYSNFSRPLMKDQLRAHQPLPAHTKRFVVFDDYLQAYCRGLYAWTGTLMVHRSVFETVGGFEPGMKRAQDTDLWFRIAYQFPQVGYIPQSLAVYHLDTPNSSTKINDQIEHLVALIDRHLYLSKTNNRSGAFELCLTQMIQTRVRQLAAHSRAKDARALLNRYHTTLPLRFRREMAVRLHLPRSLQALMDLYLRIKNIRGAKR